MFQVTRRDALGELLVGYRETEQEAEQAAVRHALIQVSSRRLALAKRMVEGHRAGRPISEILTPEERQEVFREVRTHYAWVRA